MERDIRPIYLELQGILSQMPIFNELTVISTSEVWENYNSVVDKLNGVTKKSYDDHKVAPKSSLYNGIQRQVVNGSFFRQKVNGLINFLHGEYFPSERAPFSGQPQIVNEQTQTVTQSTEIQVIMIAALEIQERLVKAEREYPEGSSENKFITRIKDGLKNVKNYMELIALILQTAQAVGLSTDKLASIFK